MSRSPSPLTVLALDDDYQVVALLGAMLRFCGYNALTALSGRDALKLQESFGNIAALVTEVKLVGGRGIEIALEARRRQPALPVLFISGVAVEDDLIELPQPWRFLRKPFTPPEFKLAMRILLER